jgi:hypothetical protein
MANETLLVDRSDFADITLYKSDDVPLADGHIRVAIGPFALTANNITYMVTGDMIGYWKFFDPIAYGIDQPGTGRMPVWGYGTITESACDGFSIGEVIYGFLPVSKSLDLKPVNVSDMSFLDGAAHRAESHPIYNNYVRTENDPSFVPQLSQIQPVLRPLFTTSFLIDDQFREDDFYGAEQIVIISASSKTALGTAFCLSREKGAKICGLTSSGNLEFVKSTGFYDEVQTYDTITALNGNAKTAIIDMAGNGAVTGQLYELMGDNIVYNCMVGKSHWQGAPPPKHTAGAPPTMFFAPDRAKKRFADWGGDGFAKKLAGSWIPFCQSAEGWLTISEENGLEAFLPVYKDFLEGRADPARGFLFSL